MFSDNLFLVALSLLILVVLALLGLVLYFALLRASAKPGQEQKIVKLRFDTLRSSFRQAVELIEGNIAARNERYSIPWVLVLNEGVGNRPLPLEQSGVVSALSSESAAAAAAQGIGWHFFDKGIVIAMQGAYLGSPDDEDAHEKPWDEFLGLCQKYRPQRPFDSVVITVPVTLLQDPSPDALLELGKLARLSHRRLWLAQNRFAMRFAVYVVVSGCEQIDGFPAFARALPDPMRAGILGWSSPYDLSTTYQGRWVDEALDSVVKSVSDISAELFALDSTGDSSDTARFFLLPSRIDTLRAQFQVYVDELMRPSAYHEPFFFRGIYFTGDSSESAQKAGAVAVLPLNAMDPASEAMPVMVSQLMNEPAFLRDLFEKKIFMEYGLARPSHQILSRPILSRVARGAAIVLLGGWSLGLVVATFQLNKYNPTWAKALTQIAIDTQYRTRAEARGESIPTEWYRSKTLSLMSTLERGGGTKAWTLFMPGSWAVFDSLDVRVAERIEREFGEIAIYTLRRELYARAAHLTGVQQEASTGELIVGAECLAPAGFTALVTAPHKPAMVVEELSEFSALLQYLSDVEHLDQAVMAMVRLQKPNQDEVNDLRLLVKYTLGADLPGNLSQSIRFFRSGDKAGSPSPAAISQVPVQRAVQCTLGKGIQALDKRLFVDNDLLVSERLLAAQNASLFSSSSGLGSYAQTLDGYKQVLATIRAQESLLAQSAGGWMRQSSLNLGLAYDAAILRVTQSQRLLGRESAEQARQHADAEFQRFGGEFDRRFGSGADSPGVVWQAKEARFTLASERVALRDALAGLLAQPFMAATNERAMPAMTAQSLLVWDSAKLDQALSLGELHKQFMADGLLKFPPATRPQVTAFVNSQFANLVSAHAFEALSVSPRTVPGVLAVAVSFDASRKRLIQVQGLLVSLGDKTRADSLSHLISQDALARLRHVDESLNQAELYAIKGRDFSNWRGDSSPLLQAFSVPDVPGMLQYLALQFSRAEALGRQSEIYLASLDNASADTQLARRWQAINRELERYRLKNPNGTLVLYEQFLTSLGADTDRSNCSEKLLGKAPASRPGDYFAERHLQVYNALLKRCTDLRVGDQRAEWTNFSDKFNRLLAGRQPFAQINARNTPQADFNEVGQVLGSLRNSAPPGTQARRFVEQLERVKAFLAPLYPAEEGAPSGYDVGVDFRVNQSAEIDGNQVIDWTMEIGSQNLKLRDAPRPLRWENGMPIKLTLRLASNAPLSPGADPQQPAMVVDGKSVSYQFTDVWSLVSMIQQQREPDSTGRADARAQLLRLEFPLVPGVGNAAKLTPPPAGRARVYLRLTLSPVGKRTTVAWPMTFPTRAPEFNAK